MLGYKLERSKSYMIRYVFYSSKYFYIKIAYGKLLKKFKCFINRILMIIIIMSLCRKTTKYICLYLYTLFYEELYIKVLLGFTVIVQM